MALKSSKQAKPQSNFPPQPEMEAGSYPARVVQILDLGLQPQRAYKGEAKKPAHEIMITYELLDCFMVDEDGNDIEDKPRWFSETQPWYGLDADKATSTKRYNVFDPDNSFDGDFAQCIGVPCNVTLVINKKGDKTYVNIANVTAMRPKDAAKAPELVNPTKVFDLSEPDLEVFKALPEWIREKIKGNLEYAGSVLEKALAGDGKQEQKAEKDEGKPAAKAPKKVAAKPEREYDDEEEAAKGEALGDEDRPF